MVFGLGERWRFLPLGSLIIGMLLLAFLKGLTFDLDHNIYFFFLRVTLFFLCFGSLVFFVFKRLMKFKFDLRTDIYLLIAGAMGIFFTYVYLFGEIYGRETMLPFYINNWFSHGFIPGYFRTYMPLIYSFIQWIGIAVDPFFVVFINRIGGVLLAIVVYLIAKHVLKEGWKALIVLFGFLASRYVLFNLTTIEPTIWSVFFVALSVLFFIYYMETKDKDDMFVSCLSALMAAFFRIELSFLFGIPFLFACFLFVREKKLFKLIMLTSSILLIVSVAMVSHFMNDSDRFLWGEELEEQSALGFLENIPRVFHNNVFVNDDLNPNLGRTSLFSYLGFAISLVLVIGLLLNIKNPKYSPIYIMAFFVLFYTCFLFCFHIEGLRSSVKYSVHYFFAEVVICYYFLYLFIEKSFKKHKKTISFVLGILSLILVLTSPMFFMSETESDSGQLDDFNMLRKKVNLSDGCKILKVSVHQPLLDYYFGMQRNTIYPVGLVGEMGNFYDALDEYDVDGNCFYYYDEKEREVSSDILIDHGTFENHLNVDMERIERVFSDCFRSVILENKVKVNLFEENNTFVTKELLLYDCR